MSRFEGFNVVVESRFPRASGDEPPTGVKGVSVMMFSPRERG